MPAPKDMKEKAARNYRVRIRMYRQGLGDCFLLSFPKGQGEEFHMLIDCGIVLGTSEPGAVMKLVAENVKATVNGKIDVLVVTHEHWDHLSGFDDNQARAIFKDITIDQLWLAWTEDPTNILANRLREERERKKKAALAAKKALESGKSKPSKARAQRLAAVLGLFGAQAEGGDSDEEEGDGGTAGALKFLKGQRAPTILETGSQRSLSELNNVRVYVVGPPMDEDALRRTNPSKGEGFGLREEPIGLTEAFLAAFDPEDERAQPFDARLRRPLSELKTSATGLPGINNYYDEELQWRNIDEEWLASGERLALQLDNATNNTSLVLAIELDEKDVLLFVGDAQAGNWRSWESMTWEVQEKDRNVRTVTSGDLLRRTIFYKVGHHGSHNATMKTKGLELMTSDRLAAVIPVDTEVAHQVKGWKQMPLPAIRQRLEEKCAIVFQSDRDTVDKTKMPGSTWEEAPQKFDVRMKEGKKVITKRQQPLYTDYFV